MNCTCTFSSFKSVLCPVTALNRKLLSVAMSQFSGPTAASQLGKERKPPLVIVVVEAGLELGT